LIEEIENWDKEKEAEVMKVRAVKARKREAEELILREEQKIIDEEKRIAREIRIKNGEEVEDEEKEKDKSRVEEQPPADKTAAEGDTGEVAEGEEKPKIEKKPIDDSDDDFKEVEIKTKIREYYSEN
jgi:hypothetical protein